MNTKICNKNNKAPYPYNLLHDILCEEFDHLVTEDGINGLKEVLLTLSSREQEIIRYYYYDEKTLNEIGKIYNLTFERIRQIKAKALRKLRHPSRVNYILFGKIGYKRMLELDVKEKMLEEYENYIKAFSKKHNIVYEDFDKNGFLTFYDLEIGTRSFNCLARAGIRTIKDTISKIKEPADSLSKGLINIRGLGKESYKEIVLVCEKATGEDLSAYYDPYWYKNNN